MRKDIVVIYGSGGHREQMKRLIYGLKEKDDLFHFISICDRNVSKPLSQEVFYNEGLKQNARTLFLLPFIFIRAFLHVKRIHSENNIQAAISTGPGIGIVYLIIFKIFGVKTVFLESWSRFSSKSFSGKFVNPFSDKFIVQSEEGLSSYSNADYFGGRL